VSRSRAGRSGLVRSLLLAAAITAWSCAEQPTEPDGGSSPAAPIGINAARLGAPDAEPHNWLTHGRDYGEQRFSPLDQIKTSNVGSLGLAWHWETGSLRGHEATPLIADGVLYVTSTWSKVHALDAGSGTELWTYDPQVSKERWARQACCDAVNRGVALWGDKVYVGALDGRLIALEAATGTPVWEVQTTNPDLPYTITGAPRVVKGKVVIGNGGAEYGVRGYVTAYDAGSGEQLWRFYTVPGNPALPFEHPELEMAAKTWNGEWWTVGGGGTAWDSMAFDPDLDLLYVGVGNGAPWTRHHRSPGGGDNLFLCSILALRPDSGELVWHYQTTPGDNWDYTSVQHILLADLEIDGRQRQVLMQAPKNGFFYVLDRATGELLSAEPYVPVTWASHVDLATGRPVETAESNYDEQPRFISPTATGGHNWHPMSFSPRTGLVYLPAIEDRMLYVLDRGFRYNPRWTNVSLDNETAAAIMSETAVPAAAGRLLAWDPVAQREVWRVEHPGHYNGGVLSTAGNLIFQGTVDGLFAAYAADTGKRLWEVNINVGMMAPPVTYAVAGEQYVTIVAGFGAALWGADAGIAASSFHENVGRVLAFKLGAKQPIPSVEEKPQEIPPPPPRSGSEADVVAGRGLYHRYCADCHGWLTNGNRVLPDLKYSIAETYEPFEEIVIEGSMASLGMPSFSDLIDAPQARLIRSYIVARAHEERDIQRTPVE
jgi:PQQ-dependent dehydrogenase (methanol/ethanol family)